MKKIFTIIILAIFTGFNAQVIIGDAIGTVSPGNKGSVLLEFAAGKNKGIIVPYVRTLPTLNAQVPGTIILDAVNSAQARMKYYNGTSWMDMSGQDGNVASSMTDQPTASAAPESATSRVIIGDVPNPMPANFPEGALVLNSNTKALVLPQVNQVSDILNPSPGMMVYINKSGAKRLAVFNGTKWSYWKP